MSVASGAAGVGAGTFLLARAKQANEQMNGADGGDWVSRAARESPGKTR